MGTRTRGKRLDFRAGPGGSVPAHSSGSIAGLEPARYQRGGADCVPPWGSALPCSRTLKPREAKQLAKVTQRTVSPSRGRP